MIWYYMLYYFVIIVAIVHVSTVYGHGVLLYWRLCSFFFKQKTAYEMRISDWSSDVCSSDLFTPPPKVMSAIVHVVPASQPEGVDPALLSRLTEKGFGQRRKMLRQSLKGIVGAVEACEGLDIAPTRRADTVSVAEWVALARALGERKGGV